jgi:predicted DNA-binding transcriptional regulator YafY
VVGSAERLVNLALYIASSPAPVTAAQVRAHVGGYPPAQTETAFLRMFERDKDDLRGAGFALAVDRDGAVERYHLDGAATFAPPLTLDGEEALLLHAAIDAVLADGSFPYAEDLSVARGKLVAACGSVAPGPLPVSALSADEGPETQARDVALLDRAIVARKVVRFSYTGTAGRPAPREVEPFAVYLRAGRWYLVGRDRAADGLRVFAVTRISGLEVETARPKSADFAPPAGFDVRDWMLLPFQFGPDRVPGLVRFTGPNATRAAGLSGGQGELRREPCGCVLWSVGVADPAALASWAVANGPGIVVLEPEAARLAWESGLRRAAGADD